MLLYEYGSSLQHISESILFYLQPFTNDFERADIHELLAPDLLHQVIKGTFKDHLVTWVHDYLYATHSKSRADEILDDIDNR
jgi:Plavaka transposase